MENTQNARLIKHPYNNSEIAFDTNFDDAPKDGTLLLLLVAVDEDDDNYTSLDLEYDNYITMGWNAEEHTQIDYWYFAGWNSNQDCFVDGAGTVIGWKLLC